jgi:hypothetical protein
MSEKIIRINKVLRELNISLERAVNIFKTAGVIIEANPNTKINEEQYSFLVSALGMKKYETIVTPKITNHELIDKIRKEKGVPNSVFKFFGIQDYYISSLKEKYLYHSDFNSFNDPFDCNIELVTFDIIGKTRQQKKKEVILKERFLGIGICCFTRNVNSILMWSHYAVNHKGFCLEFHSNKDHIGINPLDVHYSNSFVKADYYKYKENSIFHMIYTKSDNWKYEEELRSLGSNFTDEKSRKVSFRKQDVKAIYLGVKIEDKLKNEILSIVREVYENKIHVFIGRLSPNSFEIHWDEIKLENKNGVTTSFNEVLQS